MTKIKLCGLSRPRDIEWANVLSPDYVGFVFWPRSRRRVTPERAAALRRALAPGIAAVGVFVDEDPRAVARLLRDGTIDAVQLHGHEDEAYIARLRALAPAPVIQAFRVTSPLAALAASRGSADMALLDSGMGSGTAFDWSLIRGVGRAYFLAGGLDAANVARAVRELRPWGVDVSSGVETDGVKDFGKMSAFVAAVRREDDALTPERRG